MVPFGQLCSICLLGECANFKTSLQLPEPGLVTEAGISITFWSRAMISRSNWPMSRNTETSAWDYVTVATCMFGVCVCVCVYSLYTVWENEKSGLFELWIKWEMLSHVPLKWETCFDNGTERSLIWMILEYWNPEVYNKLYLKMIQDNKSKLT